MRRTLLFSSALALACAVTTERVTAQGADTYAAQPAPEPFTGDQLDNLLAPIALYPDALLAQVLVAATFPDQIDDASRWVRANGLNGVDDQAWDVSVKAVAHYPTVLYKMSDRLDWSTSVGQAYASQSTEVMESVQRLRGMARSEGNLLSTPQQEVIDDGTYIQIVPAQAQVIFVPMYDPMVIYSRRVFYNGGYGGFWSFGVGFPIGAWLSYDVDWRQRHVVYDGWRGDGWRARSRPFVVRSAVYINPRYETVNVNRTVISRAVNYNNISGFNSVHRTTTFENRARAQARDAHARPPVSNTIINRNINTNDPKLNNYRGRVAPAPLKPAPAPATTLARPTPAIRPQIAPSPHPFGRSEGGFDPRASSQRGQASREAAARPAPASHAVPRAAAPKGGTPQRGRPDDSDHKKPDDSSSREG
jgi:hypothetical protein